MPSTKKEIKLNIIGLECW